MLIESTAATTVGMMIQARLRFSACQIRRRSRSPVSGAALNGAGFRSVGLELAGAAFGARGTPAACTGALALSLALSLTLSRRQNAKRMTRSYRTLPTLH